jgi:hypothetical protein
MTLKGEIFDRYDYEGLCVMAVEFQTNGLRGGDAGHREIPLRIASTKLEIYAMHSDCRNLLPLAE